MNIADGEHLKSHLNQVENSNFKCIEIDKLDNHQIYGYGFPDYCKVKYIKIKPSSEKIGLLSLKKFNPESPVRLNP